MKLVIYHTSDLHGYVFPTNYVTYQNLGMLKIFSYIKEDMKNYDYRLLLEGGDLIQGTVLTNFLTKEDFIPNPILNLLDKMNYDAYIMGNHEFNYGLDHLYKSYESVSDKIINSNIENLKFNSKPYKIFEFDGFKICVFGATTSYIPNWENEKNIKGLKFLNPVDMYAKYEEEMKNSSDMIIILYHGGFEKSLDNNFSPTEILNKENQGSEFVERFNSFDILLSGHQHRSIIGKIGNVVYSQPMNNGVNFTKIVIDLETKDISYELVDIASKDQKICRELEEDFEEVNNKLEKYLNEVIGYLDKDILIDDLFKARLEGHSVVNLFNQAQLYACPADFSACTLFDQAVGFNKNVTIKDVLVNYPYPNVLKVLEITGQDLKDALEVSASYFVEKDGEIRVNPKYLYPKARNYIYDLYYGLDFKADLSRSFGDRIISMTKDGKDIELDKNYSIVMNNYRSTNFADYPMYKNKKVLGESSLEMSEIIINYIQENKNIIVNENKNFEFIKSNSENK